MRKFIKEYFSFSRFELRIIVLLSGLILFSFLFRFFIPVPDFQQFKLSHEDSILIDSFTRSLQKINYDKEESNTLYEEKEWTCTRQSFDPNTVTFRKLEEMGFPQFIGNNLLRYRKAGGKFHEKSDLKKLYGFSFVAILLLLLDFLPKDF